MGKFDFDDEQNEPTFSFYDFKKWLSKQGDEPEIDMNEVTKENVKEELKEEFKQRVKNKIKKRKKK